MITELLPKRKPFFETSSTFNAWYNRYVIGKFSFDSATIEIVKYKPNTVYLIERVSVSADVAEADYLNSIVTVPLLILKTKIDNSIIYEKPINVTSYKRNEDISTFVANGKEGDSIVCQASGLLNQVANTVGRNNISLFVQFSIFAMDQNDFNEIYNKDVVDKTARRHISRGVRVYE